MPWRCLALGVVGALVVTSSANAFGGRRADRCPTILDSCKTCQCETVKNCTDPKNCKFERICYVTTKPACNPK